MCVWGSGAAALDPQRKAWRRLQTAKGEDAPDYSSPPKSGDSGPWCCRDRSSAHTDAQQHQDLFLGFCHTITRVWGLTGFGAHGHIILGRVEEKPTVGGPRKHALANVSALARWWRLLPVSRCETACQPEEAVGVCREEKGRG